MADRMRRADAPETSPPLFGTWSTLYAVVLAELGGLILLFYVLTRWAS